MKAATRQNRKYPLQIILINNSRWL